MNAEKKFLISASTSDRRNAAIKILPWVDVQSLPGPMIELDHPDSSLVAQNKTNFLSNLLTNFSSFINSDEIESEEKNRFVVNYAPTLALILNMIANYDGKYQIISGDVQTGIPHKNENSKNSWRIERHGKPKNEELVKDFFAEMAHLQAMIYRVFSGSSITTYDSQAGSSVEMLANQKLTVYLRPEMVDLFSTDQGFEQYRKSFHEFYRSEAYHNNDLPPINLTNVSGGFSLPVLIKEKAVEAIELNGRKLPIKEMNEEFLKEVVYAVAVGYSPKILKEIHPEAYQFTLDNWKWLKDTVREIQKNN